MRAATLSTLSLVLAALTVTATASLFACSGGGAAIGSNDVDAATPESDGGGMQPGPGVDGGSGSTDAASSADANTPDAAGDTRIDPIDLGRSWTYDVTIIGTYPICKSGSHVGQVLGSKVVDGKPSFQVQSFCPGAGTSSYAVDGDKVEIYYANTWVLSLDAPVAEGHTWTDGVNSYAWEKVGQMTVPDGTFDDCWKVKPSAGTSYTTFCRGIGPVSWHFVGADGNGYDAQLTAHKF
jgi:hypothetical protein